MAFSLVCIYKSGKYIQLIPLSTARGRADEIFKPLYCCFMVCFSPNWMDLHTDACHIALSAPPSSSMWPLRLRRTKHQDDPSPSFAAYDQPYFSQSHLGCHARSLSHPQLITLPLWEQGQIIWARYP